MKSEENNYDVIVVGAGHAGCEAALAAARLKAKTLLITINMDHIAQMSCNPAIGGIAKGQVVREIDALGGAMGTITDAATVQFRMLNSKKGPAVWSPRSQCDKLCYQRAYKLELEKHDFIDIKQAEVNSFIIKDNNIIGIKTNFDDCFYSSSVVLANGTFLKGILHYGMQHYPGGRAGDPPSNHLSASLSNQLSLELGRLKTGTPPRILAKTIDFTKMEKQDAEIYPEHFSFFSHDDTLPQAVHKDMPCYMVYSNKTTSQLVHDNIHLSPLYQGNIKGIGTRYCPSFEDKVIKFPHHEKHLLFLEPEGEFTEEYYINGISSSLPPHVQVQLLRSVSGLEHSEISRYAYAIEYDFVFPHQINRSLQVKKWPNLFLAGQINGTSGYEEAAGQGLVAGLNAARQAFNQTPVELSRDSSYIGVMIDDLVTKDIIEPYRLFTSRAEFRLRLRQDNADLRLCEFAYQNGLLADEKYAVFKQYSDLLDVTIDQAKTTRERGKPIWEHLKSFCGKMPSDLSSLPIDQLNLTSISPNVQNKVVNQLIIMSHYEGYIEREKKSIAKLQKLEQWHIPDNFDYTTIKGLRNETRIKLSSIKPTTLAQASRIDGLTPAETALIQVHLRRNKK